MDFKNNVIPMNKKIQNKKLNDAELRLRELINSIDFKMQQVFWDSLVFDDEELELLTNFGETLKFPHPETHARVASVLASYILRNEKFKKEFT